jgi:hypothetical protein
LKTNQVYYKSLAFILFLVIVACIGAMAHCEGELDSDELLELISRGNKHFRQNIESGRLVVTMTSNSYDHGISSTYTYHTSFKGNNIKCNSESQAFKGLISDSTSTESLQKLDPDHNFMILSNGRVYYTNIAANMIAIEDESFLRGKGFALYYFPFYLPYFIQEMPLPEWILQNMEKISISNESGFYVLDYSNTSSGLSLRISVDPKSGFMVSRIEAVDGEYTQTINIALSNYGPGIWYPSKIIDETYVSGEKTDEAIHAIDQFEPNIPIDDSEFSIISALHPLVTTIVDQRFHPYVYYPIKSSEAKISQSELEARLMVAIEKAEGESGIYLPTSRIILICAGLLILIIIFITLVKSRKQGSIAA